MAVIEIDYEGTGKIRIRVEDDSMPSVSVQRMLGATSTFSEVANELHDSLRKGFRSKQHSDQWIESLELHAKPLWNKAVGNIDTDDVVAVLRPIWEAKPETADRVRRRIERVLDAAKVKGLRKGENPARWKGHLDVILHRKKKIPNHLPAMPYAEVPAFMNRLREQRGNGALLLQFTILTAVRTGESLGARWEELQEDVWVIPASRMKMKREHKVPLVGRAKEIVEHMRTISTSDLIFPSRKEGAFSNMGMLAVLRRMGVTYTVHGFRSSFRDWAGDCTDFAEEVAEHALAHSVGSPTQLAYRRGNAFEKRRLLMEAWERYCCGILTES